MRFKDYFSLKHIIFAVVLIGLMMLFAVNQSNNTVKVKFQENAVRITSSQYSMTIDYTDIVSVKQESLADAGEKVENGYDDDILRAGKWKNETWGEYHVCADLDVKKCIVVTLDDGSVFVFSRKSDKETASIYNELLTHLPTA